MQLLLVRHAIAEDPSPDLPDARRALTDRGRRRFKDTVRGLRALGVDLDLVLHSPWLRATQTAELLAPLLVSGGRLESTELLARAPGAALLAQCGAERVALVGHEPWMGELCSLLVAGRRSAGGNLVFKKGGVALLEGELRTGQMALAAFLPPRVSTSLRT